MDYIPLHGEPDPAWLTAVLRQAGVLTAGEVIGVETSNAGAFNSKTTRLRISYSVDAAPTTPRHLVLKQNIPGGWSVQAQASEVAFYRIVQALGDHPQVIPPCYAAAHDPTTGSSYILLADRSETHVPPVTRAEQVSIVHSVPMAAYQESVIDTLAQIHAYWWDHPLQETGSFEVGYWSRSEERFHQYLKKRSVSWKDLASDPQVANGGWFPKRLYPFYEQVFAGLPRYWETHLAAWVQTRSRLTLIHGDAYFCNFLCPKIPGAAPTYLLDWQSPSFDLCAYDLVNLLAAFWTRAQRKAGDREMNLLRRYHRGLQTYGVRGYSWEDLTADYQAALIFWILMPLQDRYNGAGTEYWWPKMHCLLQAFTDWNCAELLNASVPFPEGGRYAD